MALRRIFAAAHRAFVRARGQIIRKASYEFTDDRLIRRVTETDPLGAAATVEFAYDTRGRLIREVRTGEHPYHAAYEYDQGGNRTRKVRSLAGCERIETVYHYDFQEAEPTSFNNRLMYYETFETCRVFEDYGYDGSCGTGGDTPASRTDYYYNMFGNPEWIVTEKANPDPGEPKYVSTQLGYARNGSAVTFAIGWTRLNEQASSEIVYGREFRYDGARQRYMSAELDPDDLEGGVVTPISVTWSDYDGDRVYGDFEMVGGVATDLRSFQLGTGTFQWSGGAPAASTVQFYHGDQIGTTRLMTDSSGTGTLPVVYTAFGERIDGTQHRYGYAGAWGYQAASSDDPEEPYLDFPLLHVGARYYNPVTARFLQRDPVGSRGGLNVYDYVSARPLSSVDPEGLWNDPSGPYAGCGFGGRCGPEDHVPSPHSPTVRPKPPTSQSAKDIEEELQRLNRDRVLVKIEAGAAIIITGFFPPLWPITAGCAIGIFVVESTEEYVEELDPVE